MWAQRSHDCCKTDQSVESSDGLWQLCNSDSLTEQKSSTTTNTEKGKCLDKKRHGEVKSAKCSDNTSTDACDTQSVTNSCSRLRSKPTDTTNGAQWGSQVTHLIDRNSASVVSIKDGSGSQNSWDSVQVVVFLWIGLSLEHVQHSLGYNETTCDVHGWQEDSNWSQSLGNWVGKIPAAQNQQTTDSCDTWDCVCDWHQWGVEGWWDSPDWEVSCNHRQWENAGHCQDGWVSTCVSHAQETQKACWKTNCVSQSSLEKVYLHWFDCLMLNFGGSFWSIEHWWVWIRPKNFLVLGDDGTSDDFIL